MRVLISAYACEPNKGSEPGAGWNWSLAAARDHQVWVLTRANNRAAIEVELRHRPQPNLHFVFVDLPHWATWWKRGQRGVRLYYTLWQFAVLRVARRLHREESFDVVHHLTFATVWLPALVCLVDAPFVYGPVGGGPAVPLRLYGALGPRGAVADLALRLYRRLSGLNPLVRISWMLARLVIAQNEETRRLFGRRSARVVVHPNASVAFEPRLRATSDRSTAVFAGRLVAWKGVSLAIRTLVVLRGWRLEIIGRGPDEKRLRELARRLAVDDRILFTAWSSQPALWDKLRKASLLLYPSLKDDSPLVVAEAVALGVPVVALPIGGLASIGALAAGTVKTVPIPGRVRDLPELLAQRCREVDGVHIAYAPSDALGLEGVADRLRDYYAFASSNASAWIGGAP